jgi:hypothetical protein
MSNRMFSTRSFGLLRHSLGPLRLSCQSEQVNIERSAGAEYTRTPTRAFFC